MFHRSDLKCTHSNPDKLAHVSSLQHTAAWNNEHSNRHTQTALDEDSHSVCMGMHHHWVATWEKHQFCPERRFWRHVGDQKRWWWKLETTQYWYQLFIRRTTPEICGQCWPEKRRCFRGKLQSPHRYAIPHQPRHLHDHLGGHQGHWCHLRNVFDDYRWIALSNPIIDGIHPLWWGISIFRMRGYSYVDYLNV